MDFEKSFETIGGNKELSQQEGEAQDQLYEEAVELAGYAAKEYGLKLPREGTPVFRQLIETALNYAKRVELQESSPLMRIDDNRRNKSEQTRRTLHNALCIMLLGKRHSECSKTELNKVSNFAVSIAKLDQYIDSF
jgi:hypothetical protein